MVDASVLCAHRKQRRNSQRDPGWDRVLIQPETDPRYHDQHAARYVVLDQVVGELPLEDEVNPQAGVGAWGLGVGG